MAVPTINYDKCTQCGKCASVCPFNAVEMQKGKPAVNANCRACGLCVKACPVSCMVMEERKKGEVKGFSGILVYGEYGGGILHPVTVELLGKANALAAISGEEVYAVIIGSGCKEAAFKLSEYPADKIIYYDDESFSVFRADIYANALQDAIDHLKPGSVLIGATPLGRSLAPKTAVRFRTGLTADCTVLDMKEDGSLVQIRPAFGGNIMAEILTPYTRPQFATVRYKIMEPAEKASKNCPVEYRTLDQDKLKSRIKLNKVSAKEVSPDIADAERIVAAGKGVKTKEDMRLIEELAESLNAHVAVTRPLVEAGFLPPNKQIGLSGRTVKPKLIITCGVSGAVQFAAGMKSSGTVVAINTDANAPIFNIADYAVIGDLYNVIPKLIESLKGV